MQQMNEQAQKRAAECAEEIFMVIKKYELRMSEASGILGGIFGTIAANTEENFPFISFFTSFIRSYHANYDGDAPHDVSDIIEPFKKKE